ncbi:hypothetical protein PILCRDRAFT_818381 [Piloderma croceum F 1598]|uniref:MI domain-containing protein n=1 Tax=Piloderma croceum (strain F 1598) TaxID=765440 RepID=A0A0C3G0B1_PILCF|nr:hypothetical protein PILCRDRAFT_818381 [Piloderma croceum F 1598]
MAGRKSSSVLRPSLPQSLLEQIDDFRETGSSRKTKGFGHQKSRKDARKQDRIDRKKRKADFFAAAASNSSHSKRSAEAEHTESPKRKRVKITEPETVSVNRLKVDTKISKKSFSKPPPQQVDLKTISKLKSKPQTALGKLVFRGDTNPFASSSRLQREREDDTYIAYLEGKLGKGKKGAEDDGLDDLLEFTSSIMHSLPQSLQETPDSVMEVSDETEEELNERGNESLSDDKLSEWGGIGGSIAEDGGGILTLAPASDETSMVGSRYVPPHLRNRPSTDGKDSELAVKLTRQLKGLLNRMSEQNMTVILDSIEEVYRKHRRHDVTSTLTTLITDGISSHSTLLDSYVVLYAAFVSSLHKIIGVEFAAYFVQNVVSAYESYHSALQHTYQPPVEAKTEAASRPEAESEVPGKECSNLIVLLSELYNFQVISSVLVFDIIRDLLDQQLTEFSVELLLKIVRNSGQQLRQDDPSALKDIIGIVHTKLSNQDESLSSRTRFMIETLTNLKNNKIKRTAGQQHEGGDAVDRMKKFLSGLAKKKHVLAHEPLRISLEDLHTAERKGKWWLVGAAWGGDPLVDRREITKADENVDASDISNNNFLKLARNQGMNTDIRRSIFVVLMSSDDYVDACERLGQLNLTEVRQREIIRVILHCCGNEKSYNPYYTLIAQHLCRTSHSYKVTLQFCLWDFLRDLGETTVGGAEILKNIKEDNGFEVRNISGTRIANVAKAYGWWIAKDCCTLTILKPIDFALLKPSTCTFLSNFFIHLFIATQASVPVLGNSIPTTRNRGALEQVFIKATRMESLALGLLFFLQKEMSQPRDGDSEQLVKWATGVALDTLRTGMDVVTNL